MKPDSVPLLLSLCIRFCPFSPMRYLYIDEVACELVDTPVWLDRHPTANRQPIFYELPGNVSAMQRRRSRHHPSGFCV